ncbi:Outer membrane component of tripartite multidrug resistance system [Candidatus Burkholderia verschuerenii]|uniref:Outer membrane component of tripartite multidrug resistance system n=1 Tax=Candidatus Burkholderia verschuerenii TaxID=242163 RepID=A0A0L0MF96_9BURK|nr:MdtP family multidrug efflux transporter outer membrane subunit [Candidatus Burkholderia verschuerenii]KND61367.1 Outer membrane component of tripartite multidrug resistance system [Candidatus Burkholderia verschuerenii]
MIVESLRLSICATVLAALAGCALIRDDSAPHQQISSAGLSTAMTRDMHLPAGEWPSAHWWTRYGDAQLNGLMDRMLNGSPTIAAARERIASARAQADLVSGGSSPQVVAAALLNVQHESANGLLGPYAQNLPRLGIDGPWYTEGLIGVGGSLTIDLWGRHRAQVDAAMGMQQAHEAELAAAELELTTDAARLYFAIQAGYQLLDLLEASRQALSFAVQAHQGKKAQGLDAQTSIFGARGELLTVERQIVATQAQIAQGRVALRALVNAPDDDALALQRVALPSPSAGLPDDLPYQLLARRPDLQALRWYVQASLSQVDAARAAFYPSLDLKALFAFDTLHLNTLLRASSQQMNFIPGLYLPIFDGGRLNANLRNERAASNALIEQYNQAVLNAVKDVAINGNQLQALGQERALQDDKLRAAHFALDAANASLERGLTSRLVATQAHLPVIVERIALLALDERRVGQEIGLIKALGGSYRSGADQIAANAPSGASGAASTER